MSIDLGDMLAATLPQLRAQAESMMRDTVLVRRRTGTVPDGQGGDVATYVQVYTGRGRVQRAQVQASTPEAGGHTFTVARLQVHLPLTADVQVGDEITVTASDEDPLLTGAHFRVTFVPRKSLATALRVDVEETVA